MTKPQINLSSLYQYLGYEFKQIDLLEQALSHRSFCATHNERLEFLGDAVLELIISEALYQQFPNAPEGQLSRYRAVLVRKESLSVIAKSLQLNHYLQLGDGELKSGGAQRQSILADALEATIAAIYLDSDLAQCRQCVLTWFANDLAQVGQQQNDGRDTKTRLQEYLQAKSLNLPVYTVIKIDGKSPRQTFYVQGEIVELQQSVIATASSRRKAEQAVAAKLLVRISEES